MIILKAFSFFEKFDFLDNIYQFLDLILGSFEARDVEEFG